MIFKSVAEKFVADGKLVKYVIPVECYFDPTGEATGHPGNWLMSCPAKNSKGEQCQKVYDGHLIAVEGFIGCNRCFRGTKRVHEAVISDLAYRGASLIKVGRDERPLVDLAANLLLKRLLGGLFI